MHSVNYISCNIIENLINKVLDVKPLVPFIITEYANCLTITYTTMFHNMFYNMFYNKIEYVYV